MTGVQIPAGAFSERREAMRQRDLSRRDARNEVSVMPRTTDANGEVVSTSRRVQIPAGAFLAASYPDISSR